MPHQNKSQVVPSRSDLRSLILLAVRRWKNQDQRIDPRDKNILHQLKLAYKRTSSRFAMRRDWADTNTVSNHFALMCCSFVYQCRLGIILL